MSAVTAETFLASYPPGKFDAYTSDFIQAMLDMVETRDCPAATWKEKQVNGILLMTAHLLMLEIINSARMASIGAAIAAGQSANTAQPVTDHLMLTEYGLQFKALKETIIGTGFAF